MLHEADAETGEAAIDRARWRAEMTAAARQAVGGIAPGAPTIGIAEGDTAVGADRGFW